ncbi:hypothetical protein M1466_00645 [Candidatus Dependentiae bacterium]|nr:hypothetical protein [Candidatus Dependentiae bacterium]
MTMRLFIVSALLIAAAPAKAASPSTWEKAIAQQGAQKNNEGESRWYKTPALLLHFYIGYCAGIKAAVCASPVVRRAFQDCFDKEMSSMHVFVAPAVNYWLFYSGLSNLIIRWVVSEKYVPSMQERTGAFAAGFALGYVAGAPAGAGTKEAAALQQLKNFLQAAQQQQQ